MSLFLLTLPLALGGMLSPILVTIEIGDLSLSRPIARGVAFAIGTAIPLIAVAAIIIVAGQPLRLPAHARIGGGIRLLFGIALIGFAAIRLCRPPNPHRPRTVFASTGLRGSAGLGFFCMATNWTTLALWIALLSEVIQSAINTAGRLVVMGADLCVVLCTVWLPVALIAIAPRAADTVFAKLETWITRYRRPATIIVCLVLGSYLVVWGALTVSS